MFWRPAQCWLREVGNWGGCGFVLEPKGLEGEEGGELDGNRGV